MNIEFNPEDLRSLSTSMIQTCFETLVDELASRYTQATLQNEIFSMILKSKSRLVLLEKEILKKNIDPNKATPRTGNQISIALKLKDSHSLPAEKQEFLNKFIDTLWISCSCAKNCLLKVPFDQALEIYEEYHDIDDNEKFNNVGAILRDIKADASDTKRNNGQRNRYKYRVADVKLCATFFQTLYHLLKRQLDRLQLCITNDQEFKNKKKSNNVTPPEMYF